MATLPRSSKFPSSTARAVSEFDAGLNTSTAWTEHLDVGISPDPSGGGASKRQYLSESGVGTSLSDDELDSKDLEETRPARALYQFQGKAEFRELSVEAGDQFEVVKEDVGDGWSLIQNVEGEIGLVPRSYYMVRYLAYFNQVTSQ
jgi:sorting nexin-9/18/33